MGAGSPVLHEHRGGDLTHARRPEPASGVDDDPELDDGERVGCDDRNAEPIRKGSSRDRGERNGFASSGRGGASRTGAAGAPEATGAGGDGGEGGGGGGGGAAPQALSATADRIAATDQSRPVFIRVSSRVLVRFTASSLRDCRRSASSRRGVLSPAFTFAGASAAPSPGFTSTRERRLGSRYFATTRETSSFVTAR